MGDFVVGVLSWGILSGGFCHIRIFPWGIMSLGFLSLGDLVAGGFCCIFVDIGSNVTKMSPYFIDQAWARSNKIKLAYYI